MRRLVLVGGGSAHLEVLRDLARRPMKDAEVVVVSPDPRQVYSAMMPAVVAGTRNERDAWLDVATLVRAAGARFVAARAERIVCGDAVDVRTAAGGISGDVVSLDVGSEPAGLADVPGAAEHAHVVRPLARWRALLHRVETLASDPAGEAECCVVGGGAAGVELSLALRQRLGKQIQPGRITLVERGETILAEWGAGGRARAWQALRARGIDVRTRSAATSVSERMVTLDDGEGIASTLTLWMTGAAPPPFIRESALPTDAAGFLLVDRTLRVPGPGVGTVWGIGDCVTMIDAPWVARSGVYAVRAAPVLAHNLRAAIAGGSPRRYEPQRHFMVILDTADGRALLRWRGLSSHSRWAARLKSSIDERFVARYRAVARE